MATDAFVIGMGNVGGRLAAALERAGWRVRAVTREDGWEAAADPGLDGVRVVAVREEQLAPVLGRLPDALHGSTVLVPNGFLELVHGDLGSYGRGLIWFNVKGEFFRELRPSLFRGQAAERLARGLAAGGLRVAVVADAEEFTREVVLKGSWNCVVGLPLAVHEVDLATYVARHEEQGRELCRESVAAAGAFYRVVVSAAEAWERVADCRVSLGHVRGGAKALAWRNGAVARMGRRHGVPTPVTDRLLRAAGHDPEHGPPA